MTLQKATKTKKVKQYPDDAQNGLDELQRLCKKNLHKYDKSLIKKAFNWCYNAHKNKIRRSGLAYYTHPVEVAKIVVSEMPLDDIAVASALIHDVLDYSDSYTLKDIKNEFGSTIAEVVEGITKIRHVEWQGLDKFDQIQNYQRLILAMFKDVRIILIKLADRLHNMRTLEYLPEDRRKQVSKETLEIYAPFANRFGLGNIKWELEDLAFKHTNREEYDKIREAFAQTRMERVLYVRKFLEPLKDKLENDHFLVRNNIEFQIKGRAKHIFSTFNKLHARNLPIEELNDLFAIRIIIENNDPNLCFYVYGMVGEMYKPVPGTFKDYIYMPKQNGYQSIHSAVVGPEGRHVEVQIRTRAMHNIAERGVAAHFDYKPGHVTADNVFQDEGFKRWMDLVREIFENVGDETPEEVIASVNQNLFTDEIYLFTPKKELKKLPKNSTPVDFAYSIHSEVGSRCLSAKVNGSIVPLDQKLNNGDQVEIITSKSAEPSTSWLKFVISSKAKYYIHKYLKDKRRKIIEEGKEVWVQLANNNELEMTEKELTEIVNSLKFKTLEDFYFAVGNRDFNLNEGKELLKYKKRTLDTYKQSGIKYSKNTTNDKESEEKHIIPNAETLNISLGTCCNPIQGDRIYGVYSQNGEITVHRSDCSELQHIKAVKKSFTKDLSWNFIYFDSYKTILKIKADKRSKIKSDINSAIISVPNTLIRGITFNENEVLFEANVTVMLKNLDHLEELIKILYNIPGVRSIDRLLNT